jgi:putative FmdB family regulatory protein
MPLFEYRCKDCGEKFETLVLSSSEEIECPKCGSKKTEKQMSMFASAGVNGSGGASASSCGSGSGYFT